MKAEEYLRKVTYEQDDYRDVVNLEHTKEYGRLVTEERTQEIRKWLRGKIHNCTLSQFEKEWCEK